MGSTIAKVSISFGLVSVPVKVTAAARPVGISFNLLHNECLHRINQKTYCSTCDKEISRTDTVKGYEIEKDRFLTFTKEEMESLVPESEKTIEITSAVNAAEIDPILFESSFYLEPEPAGRKGYKLLLDALAADKKYAIGKITMHQRESVVIIRPYNGVLMFHSIFYSDEVRAVPEFDLSDVKISKAEATLASKLLEANAEMFVHKQYRDEYQAGLQALVDAKAAKKPTPITKRKAPTVAAAPDIMSVMAASIDAAKKRKRA